MKTNVTLTGQTPALRRTTAQREALAGALMAALLGTLLIFGVGFAHTDVFHNAAHDTRHSNAFPCH